MKKLSLILLVVLLCASLSSCFGKGNKDDDNKNDDQTVENLIYNSSTKLYLVYDPEIVPESLVNKIVQDYSYSNITVLGRSKNDEPAEHEIVIGNVGREISNEAYAQLDRIDKNTERDLRFCIYSSGSSLAVAFDADRENYCLTAAVDYLLSNYVAEELVLAKGVAYRESFDLYEYLDELDEAYYQERWNKISKLAGTYGNDLVTALQSLYSLYDGEKIITWLSNLYDSNICVCYGLYGFTECQKGSENAPEYCKFCGTGGFYYSNSGRDNFGYLPDAESTKQALGFIDDCGIDAGVGGNYRSVVPDWMGKQIVDFIYNLQDPGGFFFHPQWGKDVSDSRRSRDYNWCTSILKEYGVETKYPTIGDIPVEGTASGFLPSRFGSSAVTAVSKVVAMESQTEIPPQLASLEAFKEYLIAQDVPNKSYVAGNNFSSQSSQIRARGQEYCDMLIDHLNECQYDNGTWHHTINYYAVNGVMKISGVYSGMKAKIPNADLTCKAAFAAVSSDQETGGIVDIWNTWEAVVRVLGNIQNYGDGEEAVEELRQEILASASSAIIASRDKLSAYLKTDGSFSYKKTSSSPTSQGVPVAIPNTNEGDVNATVIGSTYMVSSIFSSLGMKKYMVTLCRSKERAVFLDIIEELSPVSKGEAETGTSPITFDYETVGDISSEVGIGRGPEAIVIGDSRGDGNVLKYTGGVNPGSEGTYNDNYLKLSNQGLTTGASCQVFESEFCFLENLPSDDSFRIELGNEGDDKNAYRIIFRQSGEDIQLWESSAGSVSTGIFNYLGVSAKVNEWFKLRIEFYAGDHSTVRIKVYFNDKLCAVSDNYYDNSGKKLSGEGTPSTNLKLTRLYSLNQKHIALLLDNMISFGSRDSYIKEALHADYESNPYAINVDDVRESSIVYDFEGSDTIPDRLTAINDGSAAAQIKTEGTNKLLALPGGSAVHVPSVKISRDANCAVFDMKVSANGAVGDFAKVSLAEGNAASKSMINLTLSVVEEGGQKYLKVKDSDGKILTLPNVSAAAAVNVRFDFYEREKVALIYFNGDPAGLCSLVTAEAKRIVFAKAIVTNIGSAEITLDDLSANRTTKDYSKATKPPYEGKTYSFDKGLDGLSVAGKGISVVGSGDSAKLQFVVSTTSKGTLTVPVTNRDNLLSMTEFTFDMVFTDSKKSGETHKIAMTDSNGEIIISFVIKLNNGTAEIYEATALGTHKAPITTFDAVAGARLSFQFYEIDKMCKIYIDGKYKTATPLVYSVENSKLTPAFAIVSAASTPSTVTLDNIVLDRVNRLYIGEAAQKTESDAEVITFDYASGNNFSDKLTYSMGSAAPKPTVVEVEKNSGADKALKFETYGNAGSMDVLSISKTKQLADVKSFVFETDVKLEGDKAAFQIWFTNSSGSGIQINLSKNGDTIVASHVNTKKYIDMGADENGWISLKVEYYFADGKNYVKVYSNGTLKYTAEYYSKDGGIAADVYVDGELYSSEMTKNNEKLLSSLTKVEFRATKSAEGRAYLDNVSFYGSAETYK